jgi:hypothetical protein
LVPTVTRGWDFECADKIPHVSEQKRFPIRLHGTAERIATMRETEVVDALGAMMATRDSYERALSFLASSSVVPGEDAEDEIRKQRTGLNSKGGFRRQRIAIVGLH